MAREKEGEKKKTLEISESNHYIVSLRAIIKGIILIEEEDEDSCTRMTGCDCTYV